MHPKEFFWFSNTKYRLKITEHEIAHLRLQAARKREHVRLCKAQLTLDLWLALLSHGALFWLFIIDDRAITVGKAKLALISAELNKREVAGMRTVPAASSSDESAVARDILSKLDDKQVAAVAKLAEEMLKGEAEVVDHQQRITTDRTLQSRQGSSVTTHSDDELPPPYSQSDEQAARV